MNALHASYPGEATDSQSEMFRKLLYDIRSLIPSRTLVTPADVGQLPRKKIPPREHWDRSSVIPRDASYQRPPLDSALCRRRDFDEPWLGFVALRRQCGIIANVLRRGDH